MFKQLLLFISFLYLIVLMGCDINLSVSEKVPSTPVGLTAGYWGSSVYLNWTDLDLNNFLGSYDVFRGTTADNLAFLTNVPYSYTYDYSPMTGTNVYAVRGTNSAGVSSLSTPVSFYLSTQIRLTVGGDYIQSTLTSTNQEDLYYFVATSTSTTYNISLIDKDSVNNTYTENGRIQVSVYEAGSTNALYTDQVTTTGTPATVFSYQANSSGNVYIKVKPYQNLSDSLGTYQIKVY